MLTEDQLKIAVQDGVKSAERCTRFCTYGGTVVDGRYEVFHNSIGPSSTDTQVIQHNAVLSRTQAQLTERIKTWLAGLHTGVRIDLNVLGLATGESWEITVSTRLGRRSDGLAVDMVGPVPDDVIIAVASDLVDVSGRDTPFTAEDAARGMQEMVDASRELNEVFRLSAATARAMASFRRLEETAERVGAAIAKAVECEREVETRGPAMAGWPWAGGTLQERDQARLHTGDHFAHVEDGA